MSQKTLHKILFALMLLTSCSEAPKTTVHIKHWKEEFPELIERRVGDYKKVNGLDIEALYKEREYKPIWISPDTNEFTSNATNALAFIDSVYYLGLNPLLYQVTNNADDLAGIEIELTQNLYPLLVDHKYGRINPFRDRINMDSLKENYIESVLSDTPFENYTSLINAPISPQTDSLLIAWKALAMTWDIIPNDTLETINYVKRGDSTLITDNAVANLTKLGFITVEDTTREMILDGIKKYQRFRQIEPDGKIGKHTSRGVEQSYWDIFKQVAVNIDKSKWDTTNYTTSIVVNIPEYKVRYFYFDTLITTHNIIVGTTENQTPEFNAKLKRIVLFPHWRLPYSITSKEVLPQAKWDTNVFNKKNYKVIDHKGDTVKYPGQIPWKKYNEDNVPYRLVQTPGYHNSLGIIKFEFPNTNAVYMHDTPSKRYFNRYVRSYSHGCIRLQDPTEFALEIFSRQEYDEEEQEISTDSLTLLIDSNIRQTFRLNEYIPVYLQYRTIVREKGYELKFYLDIYGRDEQLFEEYYTTD